MTRHVGQADAIGAENAGVGMDQDPADSQFASDRTSMLAGGAAEGHQHVIARVGPFGNRDRLNGLDHVRIGHAQKAVGKARAACNVCRGSAAIASASAASRRLSTAGDPEGKGNRSGRILPR